MHVRLEAPYWTRIMQASALEDVILYAILNVEVGRAYSSLTDASNLSFRYI